MKSFYWEVQSSLLMHAKQPLKNTPFLIIFTTIIRDLRTRSWVLDGYNNTPLALRILPVNTKLVSCSSLSLIHIDRIYSDLDLPDNIWYNTMHVLALCHFATLCTISFTKSRLTCTQMKEIVISTRLTFSLQYIYSYSRYTLVFASSLAVSYMGCNLCVYSLKVQLELKAIFKP